jgi:hypothetical protein
MDNLPVGFEQPTLGCWEYVFEELFYDSPEDQGASRGRM